MKKILSERAVKYVIGIDEAGRGPLAGPVAVGAVCISKKNLHILTKYFSDARDSKKISKKKREYIFCTIYRLKKEGLLNYKVSFVGSNTIDKKGINMAIKKGIESVLYRLKVRPHKTLILLDGGLKAPVVYKSQKTIVRGDDKEKVISLASIVAKVLRDKKMYSYSKKYPQYYFNENKGYGTRKHYLKLNKYGLSDIHRKSFI